jgi:hypothetical protein
MLPVCAVQNNCYNLPAMNIRLADEAVAGVGGVAGLYAFHSRDSAKQRITVYKCLNVSTRERNLTLLGADSTCKRWVLHGHARD